MRITKPESFGEDGFVIFFSDNIRVRLLSNPLIFVPIILLPLGIILFGNLIRTIVYARTIAREEEEAAVQEAIRQIRAQKKDVSGQSAAGSVPETSDKTNRKAKD